MVARDQLAQLWEAVAAYFGADERRIDHARSVHRFARWILEMSQADRTTVLAAAMVHDIGIPEAERKYGSAAGPYQELEGPPVARRLMTEIGFDGEVVDHVCRIVASHHSPGEVETPEFHVLWDADWLVNIPDLYPERRAEVILPLIERVFRTPLGRILADRLYTGRVTPPLAVASGCLVGQKCRYDCAECVDDRVREGVGENLVIPVCPERLGGLPAPRNAAEVVGGTGGDVLDGRAKVVDAEGQDVTAAFTAGAHEVLALMKALGATQAILKEQSPSCGSSVIYDGSFSGRKVPGDGVLAALLKRNGIEVESSSPPMAQKGTPGRA